MRITCTQVRQPMRSTRIGLMGGFFSVILTAPLRAQDSKPTPPRPHEETARRIVATGLKSCQAHALLTRLCTEVGHRLSGSAGAEKAVAWSKATMTELGFENVHVEPIMVPRWVRGPVEEAAVVGFENS